MWPDVITTAQATALSCGGGWHTAPFTEQLVPSAGGRGHAHHQSAAPVRATRVLSGASDPFNQNTLAARKRSRSFGESEK